MADEKKPAAEPFHPEFYQEVLYGVLPGLLVLAYLVNRLLAYLNSAQYSTLGSFWDRLVYALIHLWDSWKPVAIIISIVSIAAIIYCKRELDKIAKEERKIYGHDTDDAFLEMSPAREKQNERWERILKHAHSDNPAEWRVAIIEADVMLEELLKAQGYDGEGIGEMLKQVEASDMLTLDKAWEAHKVRNRIAHSGQDFNLNERETRRVVSLFEEVFKEFQII